MSLALVFIGLTVSSPSFALEPLTLKLGSLGEAKVSMSSSDGATFVVTLPGKPSQKESELGDEFVPFRFEGKEVDALAYDFDGDGFDELVVRVSIEPISGAVFVYGFDKQRSKFVRYMAGDDDYLPVQLAGRVSLNRKGEFTYRIHSTSESGESVIVSRKAQIKKGKIEVPE